MQRRFAPNWTPNPLKFLILLITGFSLVIAVGAALPGIKLLPYLFGVTSYGASHFFFWQPITHLFIQPAGGALSISFLIGLLFNMYLLWVVGSYVIYRQGLKKFVNIFFGAGIVSGLAVMIVLYFFPTPYLFLGMHTALSALLISWVFLNPEAELLLFLTIPMKAKWLIFGFLAMHLLVSFSQGNYVAFTADLTGGLYGYFYSLFAFECFSPFRSLYRFEERLLKTKQWTVRKRTTTSEHYPDAKVYDFKTGEAILGDDAFMDACLSKIAKSGKKSLSFWERRRMRRISRKKATH